MLFTVAVRVICVLQAVARLLCLSPAILRLALKAVKPGGNNAYLSRRSTVLRAGGKILGLNTTKHRGDKFFVI